MLPRQQRLTKESDIIRTMRRGRTLRSPYVYIYYLHNQDQPISRVACIAGKKVDSSAVKRHTYQRWLRASAVTFLAQTKEIHDMVWVARSPIAELKSARQLYQKIEPQLRKITT